jgi:hypothetical protein
MSADGNKAVVRRYLEEFNEGNLEASVAHFAEGLINLSCQPI